VMVVEIRVSWGAPHTFLLSRRFLGWSVRLICLLVCVRLRILHGERHKVVVAGSHHLVWGGGGGGLHPVM